MPAVADSAALVERYFELRNVSRRLNDRLMKSLVKEDVENGARALGMLRGGAICFDTEDMSSVLMDYCIHDVRRGRLTAVERLLRESPPAAGTLDAEMLEAKLHARHSLYVIEEVEPGVGVRLQDLMRHDTLFLMDIGFSQTGHRGLVLAMRVEVTNEMAMSTGAGLPMCTVPESGRGDLARMVGRLTGGDFIDSLNPEARSALTASIIRQTLATGVADHIQFADPKPGGAGPGRGAGKIRFPSALGNSPSRRVPRNSPCPCGSGRKFKNCCDARE